MQANASEQAMHTLEITKDMEIAAPIDIVFEAVLEQLGPLNVTPDQGPVPLKLEPWPGGRWYRDLGNNAGHLWGHVQSIRPHELLEIHGPMFMSSPAISHLLFRLSEKDGATLIQFSHRASGQFPPRYLDGGDILEGWTNWFRELGESVEHRQAERS